MIRKSNRIHQLMANCPADFGGRSILYLLLAIVCNFPSLAIAQQGPVTGKIHRSDGRISSVKILSADNSGVKWSDRNNPNPQFTPHGEISKIEFPVPELWRQGNYFFNRGEFVKAINAFSSVASNPGVHFYPAPGNYASKARLRLIECFAETGNLDALAKTASSFNAQSLPAEQRKRLEVVDAWTELSKENWEAALTKAESLTANPIMAGRSDLAYIKGVALENTGKTKEAVVAYGSAYTVTFGGNGELAKRAMKQSILLLLQLDNENREVELQSLVHTYARVYNQGNLWDGAPEKAIQLLEKKMDLPEPAPAAPDSEEEPKSAPENTSANAKEKSAPPSKASTPEPAPKPKPPSKETGAKKPPAKPPAGKPK